MSVHSVRFLRMGEEERLRCVNWRKGAGFDSSSLLFSPVEITSTQITKSVSGEGDGTKKGSDTMGMKHRVDEGVYVFYGSMNPQLATKTDFSDADALTIKEVLPKLFENDASSARPEGSMEVVKVIWWQHNCGTIIFGKSLLHDRSEEEVRGYRELGNNN